MGLSTYAGNYAVLTEKVCRFFTRKSCQVLAQPRNDGRANIQNKVNIQLIQAIILMYQNGFLVNILYRIYYVTEATHLGY